MDLICEDIHYSIGQKKILNGISLKVQGRKFHTILGPNGCGKTSLLKTIYRQIKPDSGNIFLNGSPLKNLSLKATAKDMAVLSQFNQLQFDTTVEEIVLLGRIPHLSFLQREQEDDYDLVHQSLLKVDMADKAKRSYSSLSGGEKQRVLLARALAQQPSLLLLDEPTNHLDIKYQLDILSIVKDLDINVLAVLHDIQLACRYSDYLYLMKGGEIKYEGIPRQTVTESSMKDVYGVNCKISWSDDNQAMIEYI